MIKVRNARANPGLSEITCEVDAGALGWVPFTASDADSSEFGRAVWEELQRGEVAIADPVFPAREVQRENAFRYIDQVHADFLRDLTGDAAPEERDTWAVQEVAARAYLDGVAKPGQARMIDLLAGGAGLSGSEMASVIVAKAEAFEVLVGMAGALRQGARAAVRAATSDDHSVEDAALNLEMVFDDLRGQVSSAVVEWKAAAGR